MLKLYFFVIYGTKSTDHSFSFCPSFRNVTMTACRDAHLLVSQKFFDKFPSDDRNDRTEGKPNSIFPLFFRIHLLLIITD